MSVTNIEGDIRLALLGRSLAIINDGIGQRICAGANRIDSGGPVHGTVKTFSLTGEPIGEIQAEQPGTNFAHTMRAVHGNALWVTAPEEGAGYYLREWPHEVVTTRLEQRTDLGFTSISDWLRYYEALKRPAYYWGSVAITAEGDPMAFVDGRRRGVVRVNVGGFAVTLNGPEAGPADSQFGRALAIADVDGDGNPEVYVGAPWYSKTKYQQGAVFRYRVTGDEQPGAIIDITAEHAVHIGPGLYEFAGESVAADAGVIAIGSPAWGKSPNSQEGRITILRQ